jgi:hypothetical protein
MAEKRLQNKNTFPMRKADKGFAVYGVTVTFGNLFLIAASSPAGLLQGRGTQTLVFGLATLV